MNCKEVGDHLEKCPGCRDLWRRAFSINGVPARSVPMPTCGVCRQTRSETVAMPFVDEVARRVACWAQLAVGWKYQASALSSTAPTRPLPFRCKAEYAGRVCNREQNHELHDWR